MNPLWDARNCSDLSRSSHSGNRFGYCFGSARLCAAFGCPSATSFSFQAPITSLTRLGTYVLHTTCERKKRVKNSVLDKLRLCGERTLENGESTTIRKPSNYFDRFDLQYAEGPPKNLRDRDLRIFDLGLVKFRLIVRFLLVVKVRLRLLAQ